MDHLRLRRSNANYWDILRILPPFIQYDGTIQARESLKDSHPILVWLLGEISWVNLWTK
jgi:hypothetical protein